MLTSFVGENRACGHMHVDKLLNYCICCDSWTRNMLQF